MKLAPLIQEIGISGLIDIFLMSMILYAVLVWFKRRRAALVLFGILICGAIYLLAHHFDLLLMSTLLQSFFAVILIALVIIFQEELRYFFEQIAVWSLNRKFRKGGATQVPPKVVDILVRTLADLAQERIGALIVIQGQGAVMRHVERGFGLNGEISEPLLKSIFDPHSVGHDGAVLIEDNRVVRFGCQLPLSKDFAKLRRGGMRHAAAMGLAELTDALCLVVSEESGRISAALNGKLIELGSYEEAGQLRKFLDNFYKEIAPSPNRNFLRDLFLKNPREKALAFLMTLGLWYVVVYESRIIHKTFDLPVEYSQPPSDLYVDVMEPSTVGVTFSGPRYAFQFLDKNAIRVLARLYNYGEGDWVVPLSETNLTAPKEIILEEINPALIMVEIEKK